MDKRLITVLGLIAVFVLIIIFSVVNSIHPTGTFAVKVYLVPNDSKLVINNKTYSDGNTIYLKPGQYNLKTTKTGFKTDEQTKNVDSSADQIINIALYPESSDAKVWYQAHQNLYKEFEGRAGKIADQNGTDFANKYPIIKFLPIKDGIYTIGYKLDDPTKPDSGITVTIDAFNGYREPALQKLRDKGINIADYKIEFLNYKDPFNE